MRLKNRLMPLLVGGGLGQFVQVLSIPLLTRLYGPDRYGEYGLFAAALLFSGMLATFRYELAVQLPKKQFLANCIAMLSMSIAVVVSIAVFCLGYFFSLHFFSFKDPVVFSAVLGISTFLLAAFNVLNALALRCGKYRENGISKVVQVVTAVCASLAFHFLDFSSYGLLYANALGYLFASLVLLSAVYHPDLVFPRGFFAIRRAMVIMARRYAGFAVFNAPQAVLDGLRPIFVVSLLTQHYGVSDVGRYHIANQLLQTPAGLVSQAFSQVYFRSLVDCTNSKDAVSVLTRTLKGLVALALTGAVVVFYFSTPLAEYMFGSQWTGLDLTLKAILPLVVVNLIVGPLVYIFHVRRQHREFLIWGCFYNGISVLAIWVGSDRFFNAVDAIGVYAICSAIILAVIGLRSIRLALSLRAKV